ncbi:MAG: 50S ribosomal protein L11 methyltransferase [Desulfuromonas sp.]|nr:MAG: 50S ribosomal protein L11 methyltransferase [Desulfuromonas sp.]
MKNEWLIIEVTVNGAFADLVGEILAECGSAGTIVEERVLDTFVVPDDELDPDKRYILKAYFPNEGDSADLIASLHEAIVRIPVLAQQPPAIRVAEVVGAEDWAENWKQNFSTMQIGRLVIRPSWEDEPLPDGVALVEIDPGMAFGTGTHGTTRLCLEVIEEILNESGPLASILDVGTGSGILSLGAAALGCCNILATDIDPDACQVARENIAKNGLQESIRVTDQLLEDLPGRYDLLVANILAEENVRLKHEFLAHLAPGGTLILSGILKEKEDYVRDEFSDLPLTYLETRYAEEWVCLVFRQRD